MEILNLNNCVDCKFENNKFVENKTNLIIIEHCNNLHFNNCIIEKNSLEFYNNFLKDRDQFGSKKAYFHVDESSNDILCSNSKIDRRQIDVYTGSDNIKFVNCNLL